MKFPRYPKYKPSGVEWLGEVPEHWEVVPLARVSLSRCDGPFGSSLKSEHYAAEGVRVIRLQNIRSGQFDGSHAVYVPRSYYEHDLLGHDVVNSKAQFATSPDLKIELMNATIGALDAHQSMSSQALNSEVVRDGLLDILLEHAKLWENLRAKVA